MSAMKVGSEDKKKLILASTFGVIAIASFVYNFAGSSSSDAPSAPPPAAAVTTTNAPSPAAQKTAHVAATPSKLDPTLHPEGMLLTESLLYTGKGRNIFAPPGTQAAEPTKLADIPKPIGPARYVPPTPVNTGPPPPPPINLRFFGIATRKDGSRQAFLLAGDDVFVAAKGDIVSRRYKIGEVSARDVEVTDMTNNNTQRLPLVLQ